MILIDIVLANISLLIQLCNPLRNKLPSFEGPVQFVMQYAVISAVTKLSPSTGTILCSVNAAPVRSTVATITCDGVLRRKDASPIFPSQIAAKSLRLSQQNKSQF